jgi:hypothetical protein
MGIIIKRAIRVKVVVTESFKRNKCEEIEQSLARLDDVSKRLDFEIESLKRRADESLKHKDQLLERLLQVQRRNQRTRAALCKELELIKSLDIGSEYDRGIVEGLVEVKVGDDFSRLASCEIVVKDDKIVEIREGLCPDADVK